MTTLRDRVLAQLEQSDKPLPLPRLAKALGFGPRQHPEIVRELTLLHRERVIQVDHGGGWSVRVETPEKPKASTPPSSTGRGKLQRQIFAALEGGERTRSELFAALAGSSESNVDVAITRLVRNGQIVRVRQGVYALPEGATLPDEEPPDEEPPPKVIAQVIPITLSRYAPPDACEPSAVMPMPHAEVRDLLMRGARSVLSGDLGKDGAEALIDLADAILCIDLGISRAQA